MTSDTRSPEEIEREIERERAGLTDTLDDLQQKFSVEAIARQFSDQFREHGGDIGRSVSEAVKRNPVAVALTGVGLAWLMLGDKTSPRDTYDRVGSDDRYDNDRVGRAEVPGRYPTGASQEKRPTRGSQPTDYSDPYYSGRHSHPDRVPSWARSHDDQNGDGTAAGRLSDAAGSAGRIVSQTATSASDATRKAGATVADAVKGAAGAVSDAGQSTVEGAQTFASAASDRVAAFRDRLADGTENLSEDARDRVVAARERAIKARDSMMGYGRQGRDRAVDMFEEQPLIAGALALAVGAAIGAALPRSRTEDAYLGEYSDDLMDEAERIYEEEKEKLSKVAKAATHEAKKIAEETKQAADDAAPADSAVQAAVDKARSSAQRIADAAGDEAEKQHVGDVKTS